MPEPIEIGNQLILSDVKLLDRTLIFTTLVGPQRGVHWEYCRAVANDESEPLHLQAFRHISCQRTDNPEYEEYAVVSACNPHPEHPFFGSEADHLRQAWLLPHDHPQRAALAKDAIDKIASDLRFYMAGVASYVGLPEGADDDQIMLNVLDRIGEFEVATGERPPHPGEERLAPDEDDF